MTERLGLAKDAAVLEITRSGNGVQLWEKATGKHFIGKRFEVEELLAGKRASVEFALLVNDPPEERKSNTSNTAQGR